MDLLTQTILENPDSVEAVIEGVLSFVPLWYWILITGGKSHKITVWA
jgi:hypothetical protein